LTSDGTKDKSMVMSSSAPQPALSPPLETSVVKFSYFPLWAKGPSCALALAHSGHEWEGNSVELSSWSSLKPSTPWRHLPILQLSDGRTIGHEIAILNFIGSSHMSPVMRGESPKDFAASQQLLQEAEDLYQQLQKVQPTLFVKDKVSKEDLDAMWSVVDISSHNSAFGFVAFLRLLEEFHIACGMGEGKFTATGKTVGECSLFAKLHMLVLLKVDALDGFSGVSSFYQRFKAEACTQEILENGGKMGVPFAQYFVA